MAESDNIKKLAILYFEGKATDEQQEAIFKHITASEQNIKDFRVWEKEWADNHIPDPATELAWERLMNEMEEDRPDYDRRQFFSSAMIWKIVAAAAMVALIIVIGYKHMSVDNVQYIVCSTPNGNRTQIDLPDGTEIWLNAGSKIKYPDNFGRTSRTVELVGEAHFNVAKHDGKPFTVHTQQYDITVKGTKFDVSAYAEDETVSTTLFEGKVEISMNGNVTEMKPGEKAVYDKSTGILNKTELGQDTKSWTDGDIVYRSIRLKQFARILSRLYNVNIRICSPETGDATISAVLQNDETIDDVVSALEHATNRKITRKGKDIVIE